MKDSWLHYWKCSLQVKPKLLAALAELIPMAQKERYFTPGKPDVKNNNELARQTAAMLQDGGSPLKDWCIMARNFQTDSHQEVYLDDTGTVHGNCL